jgi:hypothetical protein
VHSTQKSLGDAELNGGETLRAALHASGDLRTSAPGATLFTQDGVLDDAALSVPHADRMDITATTTALQFVIMRI